MPEGSAIAKALDYSFKRWIALTRYGHRILLGGDMYANHQKFLTWAESYDAGTRAGRSRPRHELWLKQLTKPTLRLNGETAVEEMVINVVAAISDLTHQ